MNPDKIRPVIRVVATGAVLLSLLVASDQASQYPDMEGDFGQSPSGECLPGQHTVYLRPPHPGSTTRAVSREPSTLMDRLALVIRTIEHPDPRASITLFDVFDAFMPDQEACR